MLLDATEAPWQSAGFVNANAAQAEWALRQQLASMEQQLNAANQAAPASALSEADAQRARIAAEQYAASTQAELDALRCEVARLRSLEAAVHDYQQRANANPDCRNWSPQAPGGFPAMAPQGGDKGQYMPPNNLPGKFPSQGAAQPTQPPAQQGNAPWPVPEPDFNTRLQPRNAAQPAAYVEPQPQQVQTQQSQFNQHQRFQQTPVIREPEAGRPVPVQVRPTSPVPQDRPANYTAKVIREPQPKGGALPAMFGTPR